MKIEDLEFTIAKLHLEPGDFVVLTLEEKLNREMADRLTEIWHRIAPENKAIVLDGGASISTITRAQINELLAADDLSIERAPA